MHWIGETIDVPMTGSLDADVDQIGMSFGRDLLHVLQAMQEGDFSVRLAGGHDGLAGQIAEAVNLVAAANQRVAREIERVGEEICRDGRTARQRIKLGLSGRGWNEMESRLNRVIDHLLWPTAAITRAVAAIARGDLTQTVSLGADGRPPRGDFLQAATTVNAMIRQLGAFAAEMVRIAEEIAEGKPGDHAQAIQATAAGGVWQVMSESVNAMVRGVSARIRTIARVSDIERQVLERQVAEGAAELARSESRLQDSEDRRILALAAGQMGSWDWNLASGKCLWDAGQIQLFGADPASFEVALPCVRALVERDDWRMLCRQLKRARQTGGVWQLEFRVRLPDGGVRWCLGTAVAVRNAAGGVERIRGITMDITERKEAEDRQSLLLREIDHRTKNALAVVHAIVSLTRADDIEQFTAAVEGRVQALARAHSLLSDSRWRGAGIEDLVQGELAPLRAAGPEDRVCMSGQSLTLHPSAVQALALAVHELAANAVRHGALSVASGSLEVSWEQHGDDLALCWTECGGPCPPPDVLLESPLREGEGKGQGRDGLGMRIIRASVETQLRGSVVFDWRPAGLHCTLRVPCHAKPEMFGNFLHSIKNPGAWRRHTTA